MITNSFAVPTSQNAPRQYFVSFVSSNGCPLRLCTLKTAYGSSLCDAKTCSSSTKFNSYTMPRPQTTRVKSSLSKHIASPSCVFVSATNCLGSFADHKGSQCCAQKQETSHIVDRASSCVLLSTAKCLSPFCRFSQQPSRAILSVK